MKYFRLGLFALTALYLLAVVFSYRGLLFSPFDITFWKDKYEKSQWKLPLSKRTLGDDGLYLFEGYRLVHGDDPTLLNAEVPPLGKYLIGSTIMLTGNPYWFGFIVNLSVLCCVFFLTKRTTKSKTLSILATLLLATDPLFTNQYALTMLDSLQAFFLLLYCLLLFSAENHKKQIVLYATCAGIALGFFAETKFPLLLPIPLFLGMWYVWKKFRSPYLLFTLIGGFLMGYLLPYTGYFLHDHSIIKWLKVQKWIVNFYLSSTIHATYGSALINLTLGSFQNIFSRLWQSSPHWSPVWPVLFLTAIGSIVSKRKPTELFFLTLLTLCILSFYVLMPFWTRYLILILPLFYILLVHFMRTLKPTIFILISLLFITINILWSLPTFFPSPNNMLSLFTYSWSNNLFADMYEDISIESKASMSRTAFQEFGLNTVYDAQIEHITITYTAPHISWLTNEVTIPLHITYITRNLGPFYVDTPITLKKENNRWKVVWDFSMYLPTLSSNTHVQTVVSEGRRGDIISKNNVKVAYDFPSQLVWVTPQEVEPSKETELLTFLEKIFEHTIRAVHIHQRIFGNTLSKRPVPIGVVPNVLTPDETVVLKSFNGVTLTPHLARWIETDTPINVGKISNSQFVECCSRLYTTTLYDGVEGIEKEQNEILKGENGGSLQIVNEQNQILYTFIQKTKKDGGNVQL